MGSGITLSPDGDIFATGIITARSNILVGSGITLSPDGDIFATGITTFGNKIDVTNDTHGSLNAVLARGADPAFQLQSRNDQHSNDPVAGIGTFGVFRGDNDIVGLKFMRGNGAAGAGSLAVTQAGVEKVRVTSDGDVLIGSTSAVTNTKLIVQDSGTTLLRIANTDDGTAGLVLRNTGSSDCQISNTSATLKFEIGGSEKLRIKSDGNTGLGTDNPLSRLHLDGRLSVHHSSADVEGEFLRVGRTDLPTIRYHSIKAKHGGATANNYITFNLHNTTDGTSQLEVLRLRGDGFVGINATNPTCQLQIDAGSGGDGTVTFLELNHGGNNTNDAVKLNFARAGGDIGSIVLEKVASNNTTDFIFNTRASNTVSESMRIAGAGQLLIGGHSSPHNSAYKIDIQAQTAGHLNGLSVRATALQNDTSVIAALAHATPSGSSTNRRAYIGVYRNGSSQPGGFVYLHQQDGGNSYIWPDSVNVLRISNGIGNLTNDAGTIVGSQTSDVRLKNVLGDVTYGLAEINKINPIQFNFKNDKNVQKRIGFSAQDLQSIIPESVYNTKNTKEVDGVEIEDVLGMEYVQITPVLVNAVKELSTEIDKLKAEVAALKGG